MDCTALPNLPQEIWRDIYLMSVKAHEEDTLNYHLERTATDCVEDNKIMTQLCREIMLRYSAGKLGDPGRAHYTATRRKYERMGSGRFDEVFPAIRMPRFLNPMLNFGIAGIGWADAHFGDTYSWFG